MPKRIIIEPDETENPPREISLGEVIGYRFWAIDYKQNLLRSPIHRKFVYTFSNHGFIASSTESHTWEPKPYYESDEIPTLENGNGFYALKDYNELLNYSSTASRNSLFVFGCVKQWGEILEGSVGYRSQFVSIDSLIGLYTNGGGNFRFYNHEDYLLELRKKYTPLKVYPPKVDSRVDSLIKKYDQLNFNIKLKST